jgi:hypothetical protein
MVACQLWSRRSKPGGNLFVLVRFGSGVKPGGNPFFAATACPCAFPLGLPQRDDN